MNAPNGDPVRIGDRYRLEERIGVGAMGVVWRAVDELLGRTVAVKEVLAVAPGMSATAIEESRQRILREGRIGARLQNIHVISMFDVVIHEERPWLVMEYLPSESLAMRVAQRGPLPIGEVADIGCQVADGLAAAHLAGVVHRDVKPGNVLIAADGLVKLTDFGVSRAVDDVQLTRTGVIAGTPAYLAPEVAQGLEPTAASDVFALGATLYAAVEGAPPFGLDDNAYALLHKVATGEPEPPRRAGALAGVLRRLLSVAPEHRPSAARARDLLVGLAAFQDDADAVPIGVSPTEGVPTEAEAPLPAPMGGPPRRRRAVALLGLLLGVLVLGAAAAIVAFTRVSGVAAAPTDRPGTAAAIPTSASPAAASSAAPMSAAASAATSAAAAAASPQPSAPPRSTSLPRPQPSPAAAPASTPAPRTAITAPVTFVQRYYALLPGNTDAAYALLGPQARSQAGGAAGFASFYARMKTVTVQNLRLVADNTVSGTVRFVQNNGTTTNEPYRFVMATDASGRMIMESFSRG